MSKVGGMATADALFKTLRIRCCVHVLSCSRLQLGDMARYRYEWRVGNVLWCTWMRCEVRSKRKRRVRRLALHHVLSQRI